MPQPSSSAKLRWLQCDSLSQYQLVVRPISSSDWTKADNRRTSGATRHRILDCAVMLLCIAAFQKVGSQRRRRTSIHLSRLDLQKPFQAPARNVPAPYEHIETVVPASDEIRPHPSFLPVARYRISSPSKIFVLERLSARKQHC